MDEELRALLQGSAAVTALVPATRINWRRHPQGVPFPGLVLHLINDSPRYALADTTDLSDARVQINCLGTSHTQAKALARAVTGLLSGYQGGPFFQIRLAGERDGEANGATVTGEPEGAVMLDFTFQYRRT